MKVILKKDEFNELNKEYEVHHIELDKYGNKKIYLNKHRWVAPSLIEKYIEGENMKIDIYTLLGMIKDGKIVNKIMYKGNEYKYYDDDYFNDNEGGLFDNYYLFTILNDEVEILETTIPYNGVQKCTEVNNEIEKIHIYDSYTGHNNLHTYINTYDKDDKIKRFVISAPQREIIIKINEIINKLNGE